MNDFVVLERAGEVGGTWQANTYPGCACDVPSHLYSFSFAPNPDWTQTYSTQPEIWAYLRRVRRRVRRAPARAAEHRGGVGDLGRRPLGARDLAGHAARPRAGGRDGPADRAEDPRHPRPRRLRRAGVPLGPLGPRRRPGGQARRLDRDRRVGDPVRARDPARGRAAARLPAHGAVGAAALEPADPRLGAAPLPRRARLAEAGARRRLRRPRGARARLREEPAADEGRRAAGAQAHGAPDRRSRAAREGHARLHDRLQAHPAVQPLVPGAGQAERRARHRRHRRGARQRRRDRRRARARGRRDRPRHRLPRDRHPGRPPHPRPRRRAARRPLARQPARAPGQHGGRLPEPVLPARPEHRARAQLDGLHDRVPDRARDGRAGAHARARARRRSRSGPRCRSATTRRSSAGSRARCGTPAARAGTWTARAATRPPGPTGRGGSAAALAELDPAEYVLDAPVREPVPA